MIVIVTIDIVGLDCLWDSPSQQRLCVIQMNKNKEHAPISGKTKIIANVNEKD
jgi:hypothetical protein